MDQKPGSTMGRERELARQHLEWAETLVDHALETARSGDPVRAAALVGCCRDAVGSALYHLRDARREYGHAEPVPPAGVRAGAAVR
ncbi:MAG TPA: hypothetical protein VFX49_05550 [Chloroflexota bacterium]|nr:hypothetical protein [Chloroflexota bacterium]